MTKNLIDIQTADDEKVSKTDNKLVLDLQTPENPKEKSDNDKSIQITEETQFFDASVHKDVSTIEEIDARI
eukprot:15231993-Ditylum_brightwellii.AAC.1